MSQLEKLKSHKTAFSSLYNEMVNIENVRQDDLGEIIIDASIPSEGDKIHLFRPHELSHFDTPKESVKKSFEGFNTFYDLWEFTKDEQKQLVGTDVGKNNPVIIVQLDEATQRRFYNEPFAPLSMREYKMAGNRVFRIILHSIDDTHLNMAWHYQDMDCFPYQAIEEVQNWLKRSNYFVNAKGLEDFCVTMFGKPFQLDYN